MKNLACLSKFLLIGLLSIVSYVSYGYDVVVAKDGSGNFTTVQDAINAAPTNATSAYTIFIKNGKYKEKITVPSNKPFLQLVGESVANVILTYDDYAGKLTACATTVGTQNSASFTVNANDFSAINITFENAHPFGVPDNNGQQAVAVLVNADRAAFSNCRFLGNQDTLYLKGNGTPKQYFRNCYIDGTVDFIFGSAVAVFDSCVIYAKTRTGISSSYITAPNTPNGQTYGYVFRDARLPHNTGTTLYYLSRPWPSPSVADTRQKTVFLNSKISSNIHATGWSTWDANTVTSNLYYGEYNSRYFSNDPVDVSGRVAWSYQLNAGEAAAYTNANIFGSWDPCGVATGFCTSTTTPIVLSNFRASKGNSTTQIDWNISFPVSGIEYTLYRSSDNVSFFPVYNVTAANDTAINFSYTDPSVPTSGSSYYYYVIASKPGYQSHTTETAIVSNAATIVVNASESLNYCGFSQVIGTPSPAQTYTIAATNLTNDLMITPPVNFQVSSNNTTWFSNASPLVISPSAGSIATTTIYIRLNASTAGSYSGNITNASTGAATVNVAVSGTVSNAPTINSTVLQQWTLTANNNDDASVRSAYVSASTPTFNRLFLSNGTTLSTIPAYSTTYGQAFGANANGDGTWTTTVGGPGGNVSRVHYEQFTVTANGRAVRVDSILMNAAFYNTNSNTKLAIVYSKSGFTTNDSTDVTGGVDQSNAAVSGAFATPIALGNQTGGPTNYYRIALNGTTGVTIAAGTTLTIRLYFSCGSTGTPRYAMLKNVAVKGEAISPFPLSLISFNGTYNGSQVDLDWKSANEVNTQKFKVERSSNGREYQEIGAVIASGLNAAEYSFTDVNPFAGVNYYRLNMIDKDGSFAYSKIVVVNTAKLTAGISIYPNPATDRITFLHDKAQANAIVHIFSADGKRMISQQVKPTAVQSTVDVSELVKGLYLVIYSDGVNTTSSKFIKL
jgi:pectinesterase